MNLRMVRWVDICVGIPLTYLVFYLKKICGYAPKLSPLKDYKKILLVKFWGVGNVVMLLPAAQAIKEKYPDAQLDFLTLLNNKEVSMDANIFNNIYTLDIKRSNKFILTFFKTLLLLKNKNYDLIIDFEQFARFSALLCSLIGKKNIIGFNTRGQHRHFLFTSCVIYDNNVHISKSFYGLAELAGAVHKNYIRAIPLVCQQHEVRVMEETLRNWGIFKEDILVILHVGTSENFSLRRWPPEYFANLADKLLENFSAKIILTGLSHEVVLGNKVIEHMKNKEMVINTCGKFDFNQFISLLKLSDLVVSADTAPVHLASCLSVPIVGLYGPNTPFLYGPWGDNNIWFYKKLDCSPCITNYNAKINRCRHPEGEGACMRKISVDEVFLAIKTNFFVEFAKFRLKKLNRDEETISLSKKHIS
jgi:ADP-heptose:LPS heptosyltransferase